jgi:hypothetical protein
MGTISVIRKFSLGQHSFKSIDFQDMIVIDDTTDDEAVVKAYAQMLERIHRAWDMYRDYIEKTHDIELPAY